MRAIVIGDAMVDTYMWGTVDRVSPEAPIPIVSVTHRESRLGGAANVSLNISALGAVPVLFSVIGDDDKGRKFQKMIRKNNLPEHGIFMDPNRVTTVKSRIIGKGQHIARVDEESTGLIDASIEQMLADGIKKEIESNKVDVIIFVDYDKGVITPGLFEEINNVAQKKGIPVAADPKKRNFHHYRNIDLFKPNFKEFMEGTGVALEKGNLEALREAAHVFRRKQNFKLIFITLSELGVFISNGEKEQYYPAVIRHISDVSGAGDSVIAVAGLTMAAGLAHETMALMSNIAGGLVCESPGVVTVDKNQLIQIMKSQKI
ncbi:D-glycero-beta-D-manno-heptose-7-phosphate kinase [Mariniphaga sediminis]|uniref:D-glycero-beta-D-manno-heptose-7-phosphate kinase n=1 Tax=Mariniphaga sediminis TaxID=1628158 RepID=A0A399CWX7_9BACT|nr:bifunctional ADP-heptose synthase [Mariniphaga sediminis]RIH64184.1 D-glycero-beta-D-manno-heptose-7-phosphate kinase [Mariniphaga sediminis]